MTDGQIATGSIGAIDVADSNPNVIYVGTGRPACANVPRARRLQVDRRREDVALAGLKEVGQIAQIKIHPKNPDIAYVAAIGNPFGWGPSAASTARRTAARRGRRCSSSTIRPARSWRSTGEPERGLRRRVAAQRKPWTIISGGAGGGVYKTTDGGDHWSQLASGLPDDLIGKVSGDVSRSRTRPGVYAQVEAAGRRRRPLPLRRRRRAWTLVNSTAGASRAAVLLQQGFVNPKDENDVWVTELNFAPLHRRRQDVRQRRHRRTATTTIVWFNPNNPRIMIETNDGGANVTQDGGRSWSSQNNQPTAEMYHVDADEQFPYRSTVRSRTPATIGVPSTPPTRPDDPPSVARRRRLRERPGRRRSARPDIVYALQRARSARMNMRTGQEQNYWSTRSELRQAPKDMMYRFGGSRRSSISPHNPSIVYHGSQFVHKRPTAACTGQVQPGRDRATTRSSRLLRRADHARHDGDEEVYAALSSMRVARAARRVLDRHRTTARVYVTRDNGKKWDERHAARMPESGARQHDRGLAAPPGSAYVSRSDAPDTTSSRIST